MSMTKIEIWLVQKFLSEMYRQGLIDGELFTRLSNTLLEYAKEKMNASN